MGYEQDSRRHRSEPTAMHRLFDIVGVVLALAGGVWVLAGYAKANIGIAWGLLYLVFMGAAITDRVWGFLGREGLIARIGRRIRTLLGNASDHEEGQGS